MTGKKRRGEKYIVRIADKAAGTDSRKRFWISESFGGVKGERDSLIIEEDWELCRLRSGCSIT